MFKSYFFIDGTRKDIYFSDMTRQRIKAKDRKQSLRCTYSLVLAPYSDTFFL